MAQSQRIIVYVFIGFHQYFYTDYTQVTHRLQGILEIDPFKIQQMTHVTTIFKGILNSFKYSCNLCNLLHFQRSISYFALYPMCNLCVTCAIF